MKKQQIRLLAVVILIAVAISACGFIKNSTSVPPQATVAEQPNLEPQPNTPAQEEPTQSIPTNPPRVEDTPPQSNPVSESEPYFTENFYELPANWSYRIVNGDPDGVSLNVEDGNLIVEVKPKSTFVHLIYNDHVYKNVYIETEALNRGLNSNNIGLICRYTEKEGWYEANIGSHGL